MKIIVIGDFYFEIYEKAIFNALLLLGYDTYKFSWHEYFKDLQYKKLANNIFKSLYYKFQYRFAVGPVVNKINNDLLKFVNQIKPDLVFVYRGTHLYPDTIKAIKESGVVVFAYNNDDPFSKKYPWYFWRNFIKAIPLYDHIFAYREKNIIDYKKLGCNNVSLLRSYYVKERNFYIDEVDENRFKSDVIFVGHFEDDGRDEYIKFLFDNRVNIKLFGGSSWIKSKYYNYFVNKIGPIDNLDNIEYNLALNSAKICLVFLSKRNNDTYTRRCFEIPATKSLVLSEYSDDLNTLFAQGKEADYFKSKEELLEKVRFYLANENMRIEVVEAGYKRLIKDKHEVGDRVGEIIKIFKEKYEKSINN
ncbi:MAG: glycosyltransferase [Candidatus Magasanikiibacteriota bacterium]